MQFVYEMKLQLSTKQYFPQKSLLYIAKYLPQNGILNFASTFVVKHKIV